MIKITQISLILYLFSSCANYNEELKKIPEYMELIAVIKKNNSFANFPAMQFWLFLIDGKKHNFGPLIFDKEEPGYFAGLSRGMKYALNNINLSLTIEFLENLRQEATINVRKINDTEFNDKIGGNSTQFNLNLGSNATDEGLKELRTKLKDDQWRSIITGDNGSLILSRVYATRDELYPLMQNILMTYEKNTNKKLLDIIKLCQDLDQLHPFNDGNIRTFVILLLQKELLRHKFKPTILYDPNRFDAYSLAELETEIINGQKRYESYLHQ